MGESEEEIVCEKMLTVADCGPGQVMLGTLFGCLPIEALNSAVYLKEVIELGAVVYGVR